MLKYVKLDMFKSLKTHRFRWALRNKQEAAYEDLFLKAQACFAGRSLGEGLSSSTRKKLLCSRKQLPTLIFCHSELDSESLLNFVFVSNLEFRYSNLDKCGSRKGKLA